MRYQRVTCPCGHFIGSYHPDHFFFSPVEIEAMNYRRVNGIWYCWTCMGLPIPWEVQEAMDSEEGWDPPEDWE